MTLKLIKRGCRVYPLMISMRLIKSIFLIIMSLCCLQIGMAKEDNYPEAIKHWEQKGLSIVSEFKGPDNLRGFTAMYEGVGVTLYLLPDNKHVLWGELYDEKGSDLSAVALEDAIYAPMAAELWQRMEKSSWIQDGNKDAKEIIYVFIDPNCPYCNEFWHLVRPYVESGDVQLRHILVGILAEDSSQKAAAILTSKDPIKTFADYENQRESVELELPEKIDANTLAILESHLEIMDALGASATPAIYYLNDQGRLQQHLGLPDETQLKVILGQ